MVSQRLLHLQETSACPPDPLDRRSYPPVGQLGKVVSPLGFDGSLQVGLVNTVPEKKHKSDIRHVYLADLHRGGLAAPPPASLPLTS